MGNKLKLWQVEATSRLTEDFRKKIEESLSSTTPREMRDGLERLESLTVVEFCHEMTVNGYIAEFWAICVAENQNAVEELIDRAYSIDYDTIVADIANFWNAGQIVSIITPIYLANRVALKLGADSGA